MIFIDHKFEKDKKITCITNYNYFIKIWMYNLNILLFYALLFIANKLY